MPVLDPFAKRIAAPAGRWSKTGLALALALGATTAGAGIAGADGDAPAGNNGHIFIDEYEMTDAQGNDPQVACGFSVTFYGYDAGDQSATITVNPWSPTDGGAPFTDTAAWHTDERTGGNQLDANHQIAPDALAAALDGIEPAKQGYHVRVNVHVTGSQGADTKHKMLWIEPCAVEATTPVVTPEEAANEAAETAIDNGATDDEATVAAHDAAVGAGATSEEADVLAAAAVMAAGGASPARAILGATPAVPLSVSASTTG
jgi:hypothetical protein